MEDNVPELVTYHMDGYKQARLFVFCYQDGKVKKVKRKGGADSQGAIDVSANAAGYYNIYKDETGCLHADWDGEGIGFNHTTYRIKSGKVTSYLCEENAELTKTHTYSVNGKSVTAKKYRKLYNKLKVGDDSGLIENTAAGRKKIS